MKKQLHHSDILPSDWRLEVRTITAQEAATLLANLESSPAFAEIQRNFKDHRIESYARFMRDGNFSNFSIIELCEFNGMLLPTNGMQRLAAQVRSGEDMAYVVLIAKAFSLEQVRSRYLLHDKNSVRTNKDDYAALDIHPDMSENVYSNLIAAVRSLMQNGGKSHASQSTSDTEKQLIVADWEPIALILENIRTNPNCDKQVFRKMLTTAVLPAILCQFLTHPDKAKTWWTSVCLNNGTLDASSLRMYRYLKDMGFVRGKNNAIHMENVCRLFNEYLTGKVSNAAKKKTGNYVLHIEGTNFGKGKGSKPNELFYDLKKRGEYIKLGHDMTIGCFRPYDSRYDEVNILESRKIIKASIENAKNAIQSAPITVQRTVTM